MKDEGKRLKIKGDVLTADFSQFFDALRRNSFYYWLRTNDEVTPVGIKDSRSMKDAKEGEKRKDF